MRSLDGTPGVFATALGISMLSMLKEAIPVPSEDVTVCFWPSCPFQRVFRLGLAVAAL
jgi:hypothetical protein